MEFESCMCMQPDRKCNARPFPAEVWVVLVGVTPRNMDAIYIPSEACPGMLWIRKLTLPARLPVRRARGGVENRYLRFFLHDFHLEARP